jgi:hypothetical protein
MREQNPYRQQGQTTNRRFLRLASEILAVGFVASNWIATQRAAAIMHYSWFLSGRLIGHVYQPFGWYWWAHRWPAPIWRSCEHVVIYSMLVLGGLAAVSALFVITPQSAADLHGSARWADAAEINKAGLL